jgi:hypothetical protein
MRKEELALQLTLGLIAIANRGSALLAIGSLRTPQPVVFN